MDRLAERTGGTDFRKPLLWQALLNLLLTAFYTKLPLLHSILFIIPLWCYCLFSLFPLGTKAAFPTPHTPLLFLSLFTAPVACFSSSNILGTSNTSSAPASQCLWPSLPPFPQEKAKREKAAGPSPLLSLPPACLGDWFHLPLHCFCTLGVPGLGDNFITQA